MLPEIEKWLPVDWYLGGAEHAVLHLLYARFWVKVLHDLGYLSFDEPFKRLRSVGMVLASDGKKMSKSLGNVVNPDDVVKKFGADAVRVYEMFMGPWDQVNVWDERSLIGCRRFLDKVWTLVIPNSSVMLNLIQHRSRLIPNQVRDDNKQVQYDKDGDKKLVGELERLIEKVGRDIEEFKFNTAIAAMMKFVNSWQESTNGLTDQDIRRFLLILAPFAPFMTEELFNEYSIHQQNWPVFAEATKNTGEMAIVVQVNGKVRGIVNAKGDLERAALMDEKIKKWVEGKEYKTVVVPGRLINFVLK